MLCAVPRLPKAPVDENLTGGHRVKTTFWHGACKTPDNTPNLENSCAMNKVLLAVSVLTIVGTLSSCSPQLSPYTTRLHTEMNLDEYTLKQVQFYVSKDVTLHRDVGDSDTEINNGRIKMVNGRMVEEVLIPAGTPGVLMQMPNSDKLAVSFEVTSDDVLIFGAAVEQAGAFSLMAKDWQHRIGKVEYGGKIYRTTPESAGAILMVDVRKLNKTEVRSRTASGRTVGS